VLSQPVVDIAGDQLSFVVARRQHVLEGAAFPLHGSPSPPALGYVMEEKKMTTPTIEEDLPDGKIEVKAAPILAKDGHIFEGRLRLAEVCFVVLPDSRLGVWGELLLRRVGLEFLLRIPKFAAQLGIDSDRLKALGIEDHQAIHHPVVDRLKVFVALSQFCLGSLLLGDVADHDRNSRRVPILVWNQEGALHCLDGDTAAW
jgi:hypothetical protein